MNDKNFFYLFNDIDGSYIEEADDARAEKVYLEQKHPRFKQGIGIAAGAAACLAILAGAVYLSSGGKSPIETSNPLEGQLAQGTVITEDGYKMFTDGHGNTVKIKDTYQKEDTLYTLTRDNLDAMIDWTPGRLGELLEREGVPGEIREAYWDAQWLNGFWRPDQYLYSSSRPKLIVCIDGEEISYNPTGCSYDSFYSVMSSIYTKEALDQMLAGGRYYEFDGELWCAAVSPVREKTKIIGTEYEITVNNADEFEFDTVYTRPAFASPYIQTVKTRFVNTAEGWRAVSIDLGGVPSYDSCLIREKANSSKSGDDTAADRYESFIDEHGNSVRLKGTPLSPEEQFDFTRETRYDTEPYLLDMDMYDFFTRGGVPEEIQQAFWSARTFGYIWNGNIEGRHSFSAPICPPDCVLKGEEHEHYLIARVYNTELIVTRNGEDIHYKETGVSYDSFYNGLCAAFTEESVKQMLANTKAFYEFGGEVWYSEIEQNLAVLVSKEFEVTVNADNEFAFVSTYHRKMSVSGRDIPFTQTIESRFVKTDEGWRAVSVDLSGVSSLSGFKPTDTNVSKPASNLS